MSLDDINGKVAIVGIGETEYTKVSGRSVTEIGAKAAERAIEDAGLQPTDIDGLAYSGAFPGFGVPEFHDHFGTSHDMWTTPWGGGMAWAGTVPYVAARAIANREASYILNVFGVAWASERAQMTGGPGEVHATQTAKQNLEVPFGWFPQPVYFATIMRRYMHEHSTSREEFGALAVTLREHANLTPGSVFHAKSLTMQQYLDAPMLADPLCLYDSCPISDGGGAFIVTSAERARDLKQAPVIVLGVGEGYSATGTNWSQQREFTKTPQIFSSPGAFAMAGLGPSDVDVLCCYDPFTVVSLMQIEDMRFCEPGEDGQLALQGHLRFDSGRLPYNTHGGLLSHAYVLGIAHCIELVKQLRGSASAQVEDCRVGVYGGYTGHMASTLVLGTDR